MCKKLIIDRCKDCCHFDSVYYSYNDRCMELDRVIADPDSIPDDCPLADAY